MIAAMQKTTLALTGLLIPVVAGAAAPHQSTPALSQCARAEATQLGRPLAGAVIEPVDPATAVTFLGAPPREIVVAARDQTGRLIAVMTCQLDSANQVTSIRPASRAERVDADLGG